MTSTDVTSRREVADVSVIVPTIGRPESLKRLLSSLDCQTICPAEVVIADGSGTRATEGISQLQWINLPLIRYLTVDPPNAVRQRIAAIDASKGAYLLFLDDDVELEPDCLAEMLKGMKASESVVAVVADFSNERWSGPTWAWRAYMRMLLRMQDGQWEGRVIGPLLRYGFPGVRSDPATMEWVGAGMTLVTRDAYLRAGGFSEFFLRRCTMNEDVDLGIKLRRVGTILFWPAARLAHFHSPIGRVTPDVAAEDDLFNRFLVLTETMGIARWRAFSLVTLFLLVETISNFVGMVRRLRMNNSIQLLRGRVRGYFRVIAVVCGRRVGAG